MLANKTKGSQRVTCNLLQQSSRVWIALLTRRAHVRLLPSLTASCLYGLFHLGGAMSEVQSVASHMNALLVPCCRILPGLKYTCLMYFVCRIGLLHTT